MAATCWILGSAFAGVFREGACSQGRPSRVVLYKGLQVMIPGEFDL